jgi:SAM-dependent methyltransferase
VVVKAAERSSGRARHWLRSLVYPGLDLHTRNRASLCVFWNKGQRDVLDAGSGNGYFSWLAYKSGASVVAINYSAEQVEKARQYFLEYKKANRDRLRFECLNLYDLDRLNTKFDEIICYETLEHIRDDRLVVRRFFNLLRPGGTLHLCCPFKLHPTHWRSDLDLAESGGHVRKGYTEAEYSSLLVGEGFIVEKFVGIGSKSLSRADNMIRFVRMKFGDVAALPLLPFVLPFVTMTKFNPDVPFSLYVKAIKPT